MFQHTQSFHDGELSRLISCSHEIFSRNSEEKASEVTEKLKEMYPRNYCIVMHLADSDLEPTLCCCPRVKFECHKKTFLLTTWKDQKQ